MRFNFFYNMFLFKAHMLIYTACPCLHFKSLSAPHVLFYAPPFHRLWTPPMFPAWELYTSHGYDHAEFRQSSLKFTSTLALNNSMWYMANCLIRGKNLFPGGRSRDLTQCWSAIESLKMRGEKPFPPSVLRRRLSDSTAPQQLPEKKNIFQSLHSGEGYQTLLQEQLLLKVNESIRTF